VQLWNNVECFFETKNDTNQLGNSKYFITQTAMSRAAFINAGPKRNADEVVFENVERKVCYVAPRSVFDQLYNGQESRISVKNVRLGGSDLIELTRYYGTKTYVVRAHITPKEGYYVFDGMIQGDGEYSVWHLGHSITNLKTGAQLQGQDLADEKAIALAKLCSYQANVFGPLRAPLTLGGGLTGKSGNRGPQSSVIWNFFSRCFSRNFR